MPRIKISPQSKWHMLTVLRNFGATESGQRLLLCRCDCGKTTKATATALRLGKKKSCGCWKIKSAADRHRTHGKRGTPAYISWQSMLTRCRNKRFKQWRDYGGIGISVCERWMKFENFLADMGERPVDKSLDRIDPFGNYEPSNCKWSTRSEQARNTRVAASKLHNAKLKEPA